MAIIQCPGCGSNISDQAVQCPKCGHTLNGEVNTPSLMEMEEIKKFNWGAFGLWPIWGFANGMWWLFLVNIVIGWLPATAVSSMYIIMSVYMGMKGGELAWKNKKWRSISHFINVQNSWKIWGIVCFALTIVLFVVLIALAVEGY